jgi:hypothetical protein
MQYYKYKQASAMLHQHESKPIEPLNLLCVSQVLITRAPIQKNSTDVDDRGFELTTTINGPNICYERNKAILHRGQLRAFHKMTEGIVTNDESLDHEHFFDQFKKKGMSFCLLYHHEEVDDSGQVKAQLINEINDVAEEVLGVLLSSYCHENEIRKTMN